MRFVRRISVTLAAAAVVVGLLAGAGPAQAKDTSWGCGGACFTEP